MNFSDVKLVVADMDGTLLNSRHELNPDFRNVFDNLKRKEITFVAASGRQYFNILKKLLPFEAETVFIAENGSYVVYQGRELLVQAMDQEQARIQLREAKALPNVYPILCGKKQAYIDNQTPEFVENLSLYYDRFTVVDDLLQVEDDEFLKIALCDMTGAEGNSYRHFAPKQDHLQVKVSGKIWLDLSHPLANKGRALNFVQKHLGITKEQTMVFGDYLNDIEMLREAEFSYAMKNAHPDVIREAKFITRLSNDENGVLDVLYDVLR